MNSDISIFYYAAAGGLIIGLASGLYYLFLGRIFGVSGLVFSLLEKPIAIRFASVLGLIISGLILSHFGVFKNVSIQSNYLELALAGLLVGFGSKLANGCTSGHGICGISRLSLRSIVAVIVFMAFAILIVFLKSKLGV